MQKVVQRRIAAEHQALRRAAKQKSKVDNAKEWNARWQAMSRGKQEGIYFKAEKHRRREEYEVGPQLAPRRDTGQHKETYGTVDPNVIQVPKLHWTQYKNFKSDFAVGDRVLVIKGKDAGKVGTVSEVSAESGFLRIIELRKADFHVPEYVRKENKDNRSILQQSMPVPWDHVRLVFPLRDQTTGHFEDVVLDKVDVRNAGWVERRSGLREYNKGQRFLPGVKTPLPWPKTDEAEKAEGYDDDTLRISVDETTHRPYLLQPPMPPSVIDELRNKYSIFRSRHEPGYIAKKEEQDRAAKHRENLASLVSTPLAELKEQRRQERLANPVELSEEQLARIGEVMAQEKKNAINKLSQQ
ncbi:MAG: Carboxylic ester hydrolase [Aureobasidium pullulans]|nr:MAG: Carboxylic ester hydrolase [Aureobasidium pullulans]